MIDTTPEIGGITNSAGIMNLPNRPVTGVTTDTGHTLRPNPFGQINVVGTNGLMFVRVNANNRVSYHWLYLTDLNLAYWMGNTSNYTHTIQMSADNPYEDFAEQDRNLWGWSEAGGARAGITLDTSHVDGEKSIRVASGDSGLDSSIYFPKTKLANWNLSTAEKFSFKIKFQNSKLKYMILSMYSFRSVTCLLNLQDHMM